MHTGYTPSNSTGRLSPYPYNTGAAAASRLGVSPSRRTPDRTLSPSRAAETAATLNFVQEQYIHTLDIHASTSAAQPGITNLDFIPHILHLSTNVNTQATVEATAQGECYPVLLRQPL